MVSADIGQLAHADHAEAIGQLIIAWSALDFDAETLLILLSGVEADVGSALFGHVDFRAKLSMVKSVGFIRQPNEEWFRFLEKTVDQIDNVLRPFRNRIVHDSWTVANTGMVQIDRVPKLVRPQARQRALDLGRAKIVRAEDIAKGVKWAKLARGALQLLCEMPLSSRGEYPWECLDWA